MPLAPGKVGALVLEDLAEGAAPPLRGHLLGLVRLLARDGVLVTCDRTRDARIESALASAFLAAGLVNVSQDRPRDGALITAGRAPHPAVVRAFAGSGSSV